MGGSPKIALWGGYCQALSSDFVPIIRTDWLRHGDDIKHSAVRLQGAAEQGLEMGLGDLLRDDPHFGVRKARFLDPVV